MIHKGIKMRVARPTDNLDKITKMYIDGLGFKLLGEFKEHNGYNGSIIGNENHLFHLEFTHHIGTRVGKAPTKENILTFYFENKSEWNNACKNMSIAGFKRGFSYNNYCDVSGSTFEDIDGYRVVLQNRSWES